jgi:outer membrane biosynthesis protein TonB
VTAADLRETNSAEKLLLRALIISVLIHLAAWGLWNLGNSRGWWQNWSMPSWAHLSPKLLLPALPKKLFPVPPSEPPQLTFVDVDPALAEAAPPKNPKFYSANNSVAANPTPQKAAAVPQILGHQDKVLKTTANAHSRALPLQPTPRQPDTVETPESKPLPQKAYTPGDLVMAKPQPKAQDKEGQVKSDATDAQPQPQPVHHRPRTLSEAQAQRGMTGEKMLQVGGVSRIKMDSSLDVMKTSYGDYDAEFIDAVQTHWDQLLQKVTANIPGTVVLEFRLHPDGRITDMKIVENGTSELLGVVCEQAILEPAPYRPWPIEMQRDIPQGFRDIRFTFYYLQQ